jgi:hypothetical protein
MAGASPVISRQECTGCEPDGLFDLPAAKRVLGASIQIGVDASGYFETARFSRFI